MSRRQHLMTSSYGIDYTWEDDGAGGGHVHSFQDVEQMLDRNKAMANHNDGYSPTREMRRVASIPLHLMMQWKAEEGWDAWDPENHDRLARKLNDPDFAWLRTAPGRIGYSNGEMR